MCKKIVLCGSMKVKEEIFRVKDELEALGFECLLPEECIKGLPKVVASRAHFDRIINPDNEIVLIVNAKKGDVENYVGPNSFAEIAMAFQFNKVIYLLNDIYEPYRDEIEGWGVNLLNGDLSKIS